LRFVPLERRRKSSVRDFARRAVYDQRVLEFPAGDVQVDWCCGLLVAWQKLAVCGQKRRRSQLLC